MENMEWHDVGAVEDYSPGTAQQVVVAGEILVLSYIEGVFYAMDGLCPHAGGPLGKGELRECVLTCPWHGLQFDVRDGLNSLSPGGGQQMYETKSEGGRLFLKL